MSMSGTQSDRLTRTAKAGTLVVTIVIAVSSFWASFAALSELATASGVYHGKARLLLPVIIDGITLSGMLLVVSRAFDGDPTGFGWFLVAVGSLPGPRIRRCGPLAGRAVIVTALGHDRAQRGGVRGQGMACAQRGAVRRPG
jgi:hypothetical protein